MKAFKSMLSAAVCVAAVVWPVRSWADVPESSASGEVPAKAKKYSCRPEYPAAAMKAGAEGKTIVDVMIDATGQPGNIEVLQSAGPTPEHKLLDQAVLEALPNCHFKAGVGPAGNPVASKIKVVYSWLINAPAKGTSPDSR